MEMDLKEIRKEIDGIDDEIIALLKSRFALVSQLIGKKQNLGDKNRERQILSKIDSIYIQNVSDEVEIGKKPRLHRLEIHFFERHSAGGDDGFFETEQSFYMKRDIFEKLDECKAFLARHTIAGRFGVNTRKFNNNGCQSTRHKRTQTILEFFLVVVFENFLKLYI